MNHTKNTYTFQEAADLLGVSKKTIYNKVKKGFIGKVTPMGTPRISLEEIDRVLAGKDK
jgi:excisionase family DNA binding protein